MARLKRPKGGAAKPRARKPAAKKKAPNAGKSAAEAFVEDEAKDADPKIGRPTKYDREKVDAALVAIAEGTKVAVACAEQGFSRGAFHLWVVDDVDGLSERYRRAREAKAWGAVDEIIDIADDATEDFVTDEKGTKRLDREHVQRSALRVSSRQWVGEKVLRHAFSSKDELAVSGAVDVAGAGAGLSKKIADRRSARGAARPTGGD